MQRCYYVMRHKKTSNGSIRKKKQGEKKEKKTEETKDTADA